MLKEGDELHGFSVLKAFPAQELSAGETETPLCIYARHKSGAELFHILNGDKENLCAFSFPTAVANSKGAAHIVEHCVLCGSERYPLKDPFVMLLQGSLQTYLNAWTFPDKTVYPFSTTNETDYFNILGVYADAVFCPRLSETAFMQEGHRLELTKKGLSVQGVVYNEMKGAYSAQDEYEGHWSIASVLPDTPYAFDAGGNPECIPSLSYKDFTAFHKERYSPSNCRIFLAGNIDTEKQMRLLNDAYLSKLPPGAQAPSVKKAATWTESRTLSVVSPKGGEDGGTVFLAWKCKAERAADFIAMQALSIILLGHDGAPLSRALTESALGKDLASSSGLETELGETLFSVGLSGVVKKAGLGEKDNAVEKLILDTLRKLCKEGIEEKDIEAAFVEMDFANKEIKRAGGPFSLVWLRRSLKTWMHGGSPYDMLFVNPLIKELKEKSAADRRFFENLIEKELLDNQHRALVILKADKNFVRKEEKKEKKRLAVIERGLTEDEKDAIVKKSALLRDYENAPNGENVEHLIPHLSLSDLKAEIEPIPSEMTEVSGMPCLFHPLFCNGITYIDLCFPIDTFSSDDYMWLPLFSRVITALGVPGMDWGKMANLQARTTGGINTVLRTGTVVEGSGPLLGRDWLIFRMKATDEKLNDAAALLIRIIKDADFTDTRRLRDILYEFKNEAAKSLAPGGHSYAMTRSGVKFSRARSVAEVWHGLSQITFIHALSVNKIEEIAAKLSSMRDALISNCGAFFNVTGDKLPSAVLQEHFSFLGAPQPAATLSSSHDSFLRLIDKKKRLSTTNIEVFASRSLRIGFAASAFPSAPYLDGKHAAVQAVCHMLSTGALWERLRAKGGSYGAFAQEDAVEKVFTFGTYRDPLPLFSINEFPLVLEAEKARAISASELEKTIIGAYSKITQPTSPYQKGSESLFRFLSGLTPAARQSNLERLLALTPAQLLDANAFLADNYARSSRVILLGASEAKKAAKALGCGVEELPY